MQSRDKQILVLIILLALVLRIFKLGSNFNFTAEFGSNLLDVKNAVAGKYLPLAGPQTSHPWLSFGPIYYWIMMVILLVFGPNPINFALFGVLAGVAVVIVNFFVVKEIFNKTVAFFSSFLIAISPTFILFSREARFFFLIALLFYPLVWFMKKSQFFWAGTIFGLMFSFHYSQIALIPALIILIYTKRKDFKRMNYIKFVIGFLAPMVPVLLLDYSKGFSMVNNLLTWIPYRIGGFLGLYPKNTISLSLLSENLFAINRFFGEMFVLRSPLWILFTVAILIFIFHRGARDWLFLFTFFTVLALFIHGNPPPHYFLPIFPIPAITGGLIADSVIKSQKGKFLILAVIAGIFVLNFKDFLSLNQFYKEKPEITLSPHFVPMATQIRVARFIVESAKSEKFTLGRSGPYDNFSENYSQNYRYLLWMSGNEPVQGADLHFKITEKEGEVAVSREEAR